MKNGMSRYVWGMIAPAAAESEEDTGRFERLLPAEIVRVSTGLGLHDYTPEGVEDAMGRYWQCVENLSRQGAQRIVLAGIPISAQLGRSRVLELLEETTRRTGLPADAALEAVIAACEQLGAWRITVGSRWAQQLNEAIKVYLSDAGIKVAEMTSVGQWAREAFAMSFDAGIKLALQLGREAFRAAPEADALLLPGGTWHPLGVIPLLEDDFGKPVITNGNSRAWRLIHEGLAPAVEGWGRLLADNHR